MAWRQLLRSIWTKLRLHQDYGDDAAAAAGQTHGSYGLAVAEREDLSGEYMPVLSHHVPNCIAGCDCTQPILILVINALLGLTAPAWYMCSLCDSRLSHA